MDEPLVSIIISNYNYANFLRTAVDSALSQSYLNVEVIVVDDGSTDNSRKILDGYGDRIISVLKDNGGQASAFNAGFAASRGEIIIFLDADDYLFPRAVERVVAAWEPDTVKAHYRLEVVDALGNPLGGCEPPLDTPLDSGDVLPILLKRGYYTTPVTSGNAFGRGVLDQILPIPEGEYRIAADGYLVNSVPFYGLVSSIEEALGVLRIHGGNAYGSSRTEVDGDKVRTSVRDYLRERALIVRKADELGLRVGCDLDLRNHQHLKLRIASLRLDPRKHPVPSDHRLRLVYWGVRTLWQHSGLPWKKRFALGAWFVWVGFLPSPLAKPAIAWLLAPQSRPRALDWTLKSARSSTASYRAK